MIMSKRYWFILLASLLAIGSYTLVDPNLVLLPWNWFFKWQQQLWIIGSHRYLLAIGYFLLTLAWVGVWLKGEPPRLKTLNQWWKWILPVSLILLVGHNALSHDIFNYLFNSKMVLWYQANPHQQVALDFAYDPWVRFMHNIHTAAPYGYGWTAWSLWPVLVSSGTFIVAYFLMKLWMAIGLAGLLIVIWKLMRIERVDKENFWLVIANPLLLIETLLNGHNDVWMMFPVLWAIYVVQKYAKKWWSLPLALILWTFSWNIKLASVLLGPVIIGLWWWQRGLQKYQWTRKLRLNIFADYWADWSAALMFLPLLTARSQWFHPWYFIWILAFLPFVKTKWLKFIMVGLTITSMWRYLPWFLNDLNYSPEILMQMRAITWSGVLFSLGYWIYKKYQEENAQK